MKLGNGLWLRLLRFHKSQLTNQSFPKAMAGPVAQRAQTPNEDTSLANYWLTILQQADVNTPNFHYSDGEVSELLV